MTVIPFRKPRSGHGPGRKVEPPAALGAVGRASRDLQQPDYVDYRLRMRQNLAAFAVVVFIVVFGTWVIDQLRHYSRIRACFDAGHRNCLSLDVEHPSGR
jgi:hypothetical protein